MGKLTPSALNDFEKALRDGGAPIVRAFQPGLERVEIDSAFEEFSDISVPDELYVWWGWHGGVDRTICPKAAISRKTAFLSPSEVAGYRRAALEIAEPGRLEWVKRTRPWMSIECDATSPSTGRVWSQFHSEGSELLTATLGDLVAGWTRLIELGVWTYPADDPWQADTNEDKIPPGDDFLLTIS